MPHFVYWLPLLTLLLTSAATAQQLPAPLLRQRSVTLPASTQDATVRVARGTLTTLTFDSALAPKGVQLAGRDTHFERVVIEERTLILKPKVALAPSERLLLTVRFADSAAPQEATFELVPGEGEVDAAVEVVRRARNADALEAALATVQAQFAALQARCGDSEPESAVLAGWLTEDIRATLFNAEVPPGNASGLRLEGGAGYRTRKWALVVVQLSNGPAARRWTLGEVRLTSAHGAPVKVLSARVDRPHLAPGEEGLLLVRTEAPWWDLGEKFRLELKDKEGGRLLPLSGVVF
ncbi:DUF2381 family protein [Pyxidicoccus caerfyrddinensis]|uniref:DUF2381 family protein n=1 Tax=Pyxidicoccus caerfyrddinensis TaxID=2709663 RepID=UPI0013DC7911|nr:DUF2381 family protein [Pyxidicoccus caerfyrddinensis]